MDPELLKVKKSLPELLSDEGPPPQLVFTTTSQNSGATVITPGTVTRSNDPIRRFIEMLAPDQTIGLLKNIAP